MPPMQGRARFAWREGTGHAGEPPLARRRVAELTSIPEPASPCTAGNGHEPATHSGSVPSAWVATQESNGLLEGFCPEPPQEEEIAWHCDGLMLFVRLAEIKWVCAAGEGVEVRVGRKTHRLRTTLAAMAAKLPPGRFLSLGSSALVNLALLEPNRSN